MEGGKCLLQEVEKRKKPVSSTTATTTKLWSGTAATSTKLA